MSFTTDVLVFFCVIFLLVYSYYIVEISDDKESWNTICDNPQIEKADTTHRLVLDKGKNTGRFIRIKFADWKEAILSELLVKGTVL